jgi:hypothetical protein
LAAAGKDYTNTLINQTKQTKSNLNNEANGLIIGNVLNPKLQLHENK